MRDKSAYKLNAEAVLKEPKNLAQYIDHTLLKPDAQVGDIERLCDQAIQFSFKAVCVNPDRVATAFSKLKNSQVLIASVVGFPLGSHLTEVKCRETELAVLAGANEIDMVLNIGWLKEKLYADVSNDIARVVSAAGAKQKVKVIFETGLLSQDEIRIACKLSEDAGGHFVKTSTGFLGRGASLDDVHTMFDSISKQTEIKASGGIRDLKFACELLAAGATRIGTSSGVQLINSQAALHSY